MKWHDLERFSRGLIDVSLPIRSGMFPISAASNVRLRTIQGYESETGMFETQLRMSCHAGTHIDYPAHVNPDGARAFSESGFRDLLFPHSTLTLAYFLPFDDKQPTDPLPEGEWAWGDRIEEEEVRAWFDHFDAAHPEFPHERVEGALFRTGWHDHWFEAEFWQRGDPTLTSEAAAYLMERGLRYLASDFTFTFEGDATHDVVLTHPEGNRFLVENLCNLGQIDSDVVGLFIAPLKVESCEALPARVYAIPLGVA